MIHEFMMVPFGVPLPKDHAPKMFAIFFQRIVRVFLIHPEFAGLAGPGVDFMKQFRP
jgi:hypothetical protein